MFGMFFLLEWPLSQWICKDNNHSYFKNPHIPQCLEHSRSTINFSFFQFLTSKNTQIHPAHNLKKYISVWNILLYHTVYMQYDRLIYTLLRGVVLYLVAQSCPTLGDPTDCSPPGSAIHGILQTRILEWIAMSSSRGSSRSRHQTQVYCFAGGFLTIWATRYALV